MSIPTSVPCSNIERLRKHIEASQDLIRRHESGCAECRSTKPKPEGIAVCNARSGSIRCHLVAGHKGRHNHDGLRWDDKPTPEPKSCGDVNGDAVCSLPLDHHGKHRGDLTSWL